jgi:tryptophan synthase beta chain
MLNYQQPDARGHFGPYGGTFVAETLIHALDELKAAYEHYRNDPEFRPSSARTGALRRPPQPVYHAAR